MTTRDVQRLARENGLFFAPDPGAAEQSQIGGNVATNAGGPHALKYGVTGAWVAGLEVGAGARASWWSIGGWAARTWRAMTCKNLLIGSEGTLGIITAVRLRLLPAPAVDGRVVAVPATTARRAARRSLELLAAGLRPSVLDFLDGETLAMLAAPTRPRGERSGGPAGEARGAGRRGLRA